MPSSVYVGNISHKVSATDLRHLFQKYGPIVDIIMKGRWAIVIFEHFSDAKKSLAIHQSKAITHYDGRIVVELLNQNQNQQNSKEDQLSNSETYVGLDNYQKDFRFEDRCLKCWNFGHFDSECVQVKEYLYKQFWSLQKCFYCQQAGHIKQNCPKRKKFQMKKQMRGSPNQQERHINSRQDGEYEQVEREEREEHWPIEEVGEQGEQWSGENIEIRFEVPEPNNGEMAYTPAQQEEVEEGEFISAERPLEV